MHQSPMGVDSTTPSAPDAILRHYSYNAVEARAIARQKGHLITKFNSKSPSDKGYNSESYSAPQNIKDGNGKVKDTRLQRTNSCGVVEHGLNGHFTNTSPRQSSDKITRKERVGANYLPILYRSRNILISNCPIVINKTNFTSLAPPTTRNTESFSKAPQILADFRKDRMLFKPSDGQMLKERITLYERRDSEVGKAVITLEKMESNSAAKL